MDPPEVTPRLAATTVGYLLLGTLGTVAVALVATNLLQPVQAPLYAAVYLDLGPSGATEVAVLGHFVLSAAVAVVVPTLLAEYVSDRGENVRAIAAALAVVGLLLVIFALVAVVGSVSLPLALAAIGIAIVAVPLLLWARFDVRSGAIPALVGAAPALVFLLLLAGFGLAWGWGFVVVAEEVPASSVEGVEVVDFDGVPEVREDLFGGDCRERADGTRVCNLQLRGYEHELEATRFLADHGVRCPYQGTGADGGSFVARHGDRYYRVSCSSHGD